MGEDESRKWLAALMASEQAREASAGARPKPSFEVREVTLVYAAPRGYAAWCEARPPAAVAERSTSSYPSLLDIVFRHDGLVDKLVFGGVLALFGAPQPNEHHARAAVACARELASSSDELSIAVHTGEAAIGFIGSPRTMTYTALGDSVNRTAALWQGAEARSARVLVSDATRRCAGKIGDAIALGALSLPGLKEPLETFELAGIAPRRGHDGPPKK